MKIISTLLLFISGFFIACQSNNDSELQVIDVHVKDTIEVNISEVATDFSILKLETSDSCLISGIGGLVRTNNYIFMNGGRKVMLFDTDGNFIRQIGRQGHGPGEYVSVMCFAVDTEKELVIVSSNYDVIFYDFNGNFIKSIKVNTPVECIYQGDQGFQLLASRNGVDTGNGNYATHVYLYDLNDDLEISDSLLLRNIMLDNGTMGFFPSNHFSETAGTTYFYYPFIAIEPVLRDTLYQFVDGKLIPSVKLKFDMPYKATETTRNISIYSIHRTERFLIATYATQGKGHQFFYDLKDHISYDMTRGFIDDFLNSGKAKLQLFNTKKSEFFFVKAGYELEGIVDGMDENSNPAIIFVTLKK